VKRTFRLLQWASGFLFLYNYIYIIKWVLAKQLNSINLFNIVGGCRERVKQIRGGKNIKKSGDWIQEKKERRRRQGKWVYSYSSIHFQFHRWILYTFRRTHNQDVFSLILSSTIFLIKRLILKWSLVLHLSVRLKSNIITLILK